MTTALWFAQGFAALVFLLTGTLKLVTPKGLAVLMVGAIQTQRRLHESFLPPLVLALVCVGIAAGRFHFGA